MSEGVISQEAATQDAGPGASNTKDKGEGGRASIAAKPKPRLTWRILLWAPKRARWDDDNPPPFTLGLNILYAFVRSRRTPPFPLFPPPGLR